MSVFCLQIDAHAVCTMKSLLCGQLVIQLTNTTRTGQLLTFLKCILSSLVGTINDFTNLKQEFEQIRVSEKNAELKWRSSNKIE